MKLFGAVLFICCIFPTGHLLAQSQLHVETGAVWQQRNDVQVPGTTGSRFALDEIAGSGPTEFVRVVFSTVWHDRHSLRLVYAPLRIKEAGTSLQALDFSGTAFDDGELVATYQFDAHRASYRYRVLQTDRSALHVGATLLVRDAEIRLDGSSDSIWMDWPRRKAERLTSGCKAVLRSVTSGPGLSVTGYWTVVSTTTRCTTLLAFITQPRAFECNSEEPQTRRNTSKTDFILSMAY